MHEAWPAWLVNLPEAQTVHEPDHEPPAPAVALAAHLIVPENPVTQSQLLPEPLLSAGHATFLQVRSRVAVGAMDSVVPTRHVEAFLQFLPVPKKPVLQVHECWPGPVRAQRAWLWQSSVPARHGWSSVQVPVNLVTEASHAMNPA